MSAGFERRVRRETNDVFASGTARATLLQRAATTSSASSLAVPEDFEHVLLSRRASARNDERRRRPRERESRFLTTFRARGARARRSADDGGAAVARVGRVSTALAGTRAPVASPISSMSRVSSNWRRARSASRSARDAGASQSVRLRRGWCSIAAQRFRHRRFAPRSRPRSAGRGIDAVRRELAVAIPSALSHAAVRRVVEDRRGQEVEARLALRLVDVHAFPSPPLVIERGQDRGNGEARRNVIGIGAVGPGGRTVRPDGQVVEAGDRRREVAEARVVRERARSALRVRCQHMMSGFTLRSDS